MLWAGRERGGAGLESLAGSQNTCLLPQAHDVAVKKLDASPSRHVVGSSSSSPLNHSHSWPGFTLLISGVLANF